MKNKGRDRFSSYPEPYLTRFCTRQDCHASPSPTVCLARHPDQRFPQPPPVRVVSKFRRGLRVILNTLIREGKLRLGRVIVEAWPTQTPAVRARAPAA